MLIRYDYGNGWIDNNNEKVRLESFLVSERLGENVEAVEDPYSYDTCNMLLIITKESAIIQSFLL